MSLYKRTVKTRLEEEEEGPLRKSRRPGVPSVLSRPSSAHTSSILRGRPNAPSRQLSLAKVPSPYGTSVTGFPPDR